VRAPERVEHPARRSGRGPVQLSGVVPTLASWRVGPVPRSSGGDLRPYSSWSSPGQPRPGAVRRPKVRRSTRSGEHRRECYRDQWTRSGPRHRGTCHALTMLSGARHPGTCRAQPPMNEALRAKSRVQPPMNEGRHHECYCVQWTTNEGPHHDCCYRGQRTRTNEQRHHDCCYRALVVLTGRTRRGRRSDRSSRSEGSLHGRGCRLFLAP